MTTERLYEFLILSQMLSYSKAAKKLFMTQSTLSRHIMELEKELGVTVLERSTHAVSLTHAGKILAQRAKPLIEKSESAINRLHMSGLQTSGNVSIASLDSDTLDQLHLFLALFSEKFPEIELNVDVIGSGDHATPLERYDLVFSPFELQNLPAQVESRVVFHDPGVLAVLPNHRYIYNHRIALEELVGETLFVPYPGELLCSYASNRQLVEKMTGYRVNVVRVPTVESALMMTALGKGVTIVPQHISKTAPGDTWLIGITTSGCVFDTHLYLNAQRNNPAAKLMMDELDQFSQNGENH